MFNIALSLPLPSTQVLAQKPAVVWFTGLSGAGKTTTATAVQARLTALGYRAFVLDGDHTRRGLCADLGYSATDRRENIRRNACGRSGAGSAAGTGCYRVAPCTIGRQRRCLPVSR